MNKMLHSLLFTRLQLYALHSGLAASPVAAAAPALVPSNPLLLQYNLKGP